MLVSLVVCTFDRDRSRMCSAVARVTKLCVCPTQRTSNRRPERSEPEITALTAGCKGSLARSAAKKCTHSSCITWMSQFSICARLHYKLLFSKFFPLRMLLKYVSIRTRQTAKCMNTFPAPVPQEKHEENTEQKFLNAKLFFFTFPFLCAISMCHLAAAVTRNII